MKDDKGRWRDKKGDFTHPDMIRVDKKLEDELVRSLISNAKSLNEELAEFKANTFAACYDFLDLLRQEYDVERITGKTGSVTLKSYDGTKIVEVQVAKLIEFDAKLKLAKETIDKYLEEVTSHSEPEIKTLITRAFDVNNGRVDPKKIIALKAYDIKHPTWLKAMKLIDDATEISGTKSYIRFKEKACDRVDGHVENIVLNFASIEVDDEQIEDKRKKGEEQ